MIADSEKFYREPRMSKLKKILNVKIGDLLADLTE